MAARSPRKRKATTELAPETDPRAPLDSGALLAAARPVLKLLDADLLERAKGSAAVTAALRARHAEEKAAERTADDYGTWLGRFVAQVGAAWLLSCVFVRTLEDRGLLGQSRIAGPGAADAQRLFFELAPSLTERDYLLMVFREVSHHAAARALFDARHNPVWLLAPSAEAAKTLLALFRAPSADAPAFRFGQADTRFLGDLYQDLDEDVRDRFALLQTPHFVESFILDRTLEPAIERFGLDDTDLVDPTCGSGHFLLGAFDRLFEHRLRNKPGLTRRQAALEALDKVHGADINPYAVAIAKLRLTLSFLEKAGYPKLAEAPRLPLHVAVADSLLYNPQHTQQALFHQEGVDAAAWERRAFSLEDEQEAREVLHRQYAAVVGNPPYITVKDAALRERYRKLYASAAGQYSLSVPFCERFFQLARSGGRVGQITANSFMKREFGKKLVAEYLPTVNLDLVVNTSGAFIPGHGTPTVLLFGAHERPQGDSVLAVLAKRGEPSTPADPAQGLVWRSIADHWQEVGFENDYVSVAKVERASLGQHPWSLAGGGAAELKALLEERADKRLGDVVQVIGFGAVTREDELFEIPLGAARRLGLPDLAVAEYGYGEAIRDWHFSHTADIVLPYGSSGTLPPERLGNWIKLAWRLRTQLWLRQGKGFKTKRESGGQYYEYSMFYPERYFAPLKIAFAFVATHNHFVLDRGGKVFNRTAPVVKLPEGATEEDHLALLAYLNSSTAAFVFRQNCHSKGAQGVNEGHKSEEWEQFLEYAGSMVEKTPLPPRWQSLAVLGAKLCRATELGDFATAVMLQETLDWTVYAMFGLVDDPLLTSDDTSIRVGGRPFEISLAGREPETAWFSRHGYPKPTDCGTAPPICQARLRAIDSNRFIALLERPQLKRPWQLPPKVEDLRATSVRRELLDAVENTIREAPGVSANRLGGTGSVHGTEVDGSELSRLIGETAAPFLAAYRYTDSGLAKRALWERTWDLQRREDAGESVGDIPVPPRYEQGDYRSTVFWRLRGKLDVPKERFISYPGCESDQDGEPLYGWAGWNHEQRAKALATLYWARKNDEGWPKERLTPMLAGLLELLFWLELWHSEKSDDYGGDSPAAYYAGFLAAECRALGLTHDDLRAWRPPQKAAAKRRGKRARE